MLGSNQVLSLSYGLSITILTSHMRNPELRQVNPFVYSHRALSGYEEIEIGNEFHGACRAPIWRMSTNFPEISPSLRRDKQGW